MNALLLDVVGLRFEKKRGLTRSAGATDTWNYDQGHKRPLKQDDMPLSQSNVGAIRAQWGYDITAVGGQSEVKWPAPEAPLEAAPVKGHGRSRYADAECDGSWAR
ncbi:hypothetical protein FZEAL_10365 [Fusarium zealandicum]|uniref:Uncharacterized protein n=1 Tax=Fusarium zealandicum TaxID=1053134 RepID=A0A8H4XBX9_9HYPO|nr:hypothetical protein FZEAL_10365 [Fusarium zealandicum]